MKKQILIITILFLSITIYDCVQAQQLNYHSIKQLEEILKDKSLSYPRLFFKKNDINEIVKKINSDSLLKKLFQQMKEETDKIEKAPLPEQIFEGHRMLVPTSRVYLKNILYLSFTYLITKEVRYAIKAKEHIIKAANFKDWNPDHYLDTAEMLTAFAIGYDWIYPTLSSEDKKIIKKAIITKGIKPSFGKQYHWLEGNNNWTQVCHSGLLLGALIVLEDEPKLSIKVINRSLKNIIKPMRQYTPDGAYPEGPTYWFYGTMFSVLLIDSMKSVLGTDFNISNIKGFLESSDYFLHTSSNITYQIFNYADSGSGSKPKLKSLPLMYWFASKRKKPSVLWIERKKLNLFLQADNRRKWTRFFPFIFIWGENFDKISPPRETNWKGDGVTPIATHRSGWEYNDTFIGFKAGSPQVPHNHMDIGSFVLDMLGERWAIDFGSQPYYSLEKFGVKLWDYNNKRWTVFRYNSLSHNTLVVDNKLQYLKANALIINYSSKKSFSIIDAGSAYKNQLATSIRGVRVLQDKSVIIQDEIKALNKKETSIRWGMVTKAKVEIKNNRTAYLRKNGKIVYFRILSPKDAKIEIYETENPPNYFDAKNKYSKMIGFTIKLASSEKEEIIVHISPHKTNKKLKIIDLDKW